MANQARRKPPTSTMMRDASNHSSGSERARTTARWMSEMASLSSASAERASWPGPRSVTTSTRRRRPSISTGEAVTVTGTSRPEAVTWFTAKEAPLPAATDRASRSRSGVERLIAVSVWPTRSSRARP